MSESLERPWVTTRRALRGWTLWDWALWGLPRRVVLVVLLVEVAAVSMVAGSVVAASAAEPFAQAGHLQLVTVLALLGVAHTEVATGVERIRRRGVDQGEYFDLSSVWTFAAAVLLPPALAACVIAALYTHLWLRVCRRARVPLYRHVFTTATIVLAALTAHAVLKGAGAASGWTDDASGLATVVVAMAGYVVVNMGLVAAVIAVSGKWRRLTDLIGDWDDNLLEIATLSLGVLAAIALATNPWLVVLLLPPLLVLHRAVLVRHLEEVASTDGKTGLLNAIAWRARAARELRRAQRSGSVAAVLILDLDHFKAVNDAHGHLAGDEVLAAVAAAMRAEVREYDVVGRFGGEEFVVLLPDLPPESAGRGELHAIAERLRHRVSQLTVAVGTPDGPLTIGGLSASVGGASFPANGLGVDQVLDAADKALYTAKRDGRNVVRLAPLPPEREAAA